MSFNDQLRDLIVLRSILIESLKGTIANKISTQYLRVLNDIIKQLKTYDEVNIVNVNKVIKELQKRIDPKLTLLSDMEELAYSEANYIPTAINALAGFELFNKIPRDSIILKIANSELYQGHTIFETMKSFDTKIAFDLEGEVKLAVLNGETIPQITTRLNKLLNVKASQAQSIARTATQTLVEQVRMATYEENEDVIKGYMSVSVLDGRVSDICLAYADKLYDIDKKPVGHSLPFSSCPRHPNCRSLHLPIMKSFKEMGIDDDVEIPPATRSSLDGAIPQSTTMEQWLKSKDKAFVEKVLGVGKADLFLKGKISLSDLVKKNSEVRTIKELEELSK